MRDLVQTFNARPDAYNARALLDFMRASPFAIMQANAEAIDALARASIIANRRVKGGRYGMLAIVGGY